MSAMKNLLDYNYMSDPIDPSADDPANYPPFYEGDNASVTCPSVEFKAPIPAILYNEPPKRRVEPTDPDEIPF